MSFSLQNCLYATSILVGFWAILSGMEWFVSRQLFLASGPYTWDVLRLRPMPIRHRYYPKGVGSVRLVMFFALLRALAGALLITRPSPLSTIVLNGGIIASCFYFNLRTFFGGDGSDQMGLVVTIGSTLICLGLYLGDRTLSLSGVVWICGQATLAYFVAGASKLFSPAWRSGGAVFGVMKTETYGNRWAVKFLETNRLASYLIGWFVILAELAFPLVFVLPLWLSILLLTRFAVFHISNAVFMGLNNFIFPFIATYPAVIWANLALNH
jgi:hypothetical protein